LKNKSKNSKRTYQKGMRKSVGKAGRGTSYFDAYGASYDISREGKKRLADWKLGNSFGPASDVRYIDPSKYKLEDT